MEEKKKTTQAKKSTSTKKCDRAKNAKKSLQKREGKKTSEASEKIRRRRKNGNKKYESASAKKMEVYKGVKTGTGKKTRFQGQSRPTNKGHFEKVGPGGSIMREKVTKML